MVDLFQAIELASVWE